MYRLQFGAFMKPFTHLSIPKLIVYAVATCPNRTSDPPARNSPATCVNFKPKWGSYSAN